MIQLSLALLLAAPAASQTRLAVPAGRAVLAAPALSASAVPSAGVSLAAQASPLSAPLLAAPAFGPALAAERAKPASSENRDEPQPKLPRASGVNFDGSAPRPQGSFDERFLRLHRVVASGGKTSPSRAASSSPASAPRIRGKVEWWDRGYSRGRIIPDDGSAPVMAQGWDLEYHDVVEFEVEVRANGERWAKNVKRLNNRPPPIPLSVEAWTKPRPKPIPPVKLAELSGQPDHGAWNAIWSEEARWLMAKRDRWERAAVARDFYAPDLEGRMIDSIPVPGTPYRVASADRGRFSVVFEPAPATRTMVIRAVVPTRLSGDERQLRAVVERESRGLIRL